MKYHRLWSSIFLSAILGAQSLPVVACAFSTDPYFTFTNHPDIPLARYAAGELGVLQSGYARSYLVTAYRYLIGKPLSAAEQQAALSFWDKRLSSPDATDGCVDASEQWLTARKAVPGASKVDRVDYTRAVSPSEGWHSYCNCQPDGFKTAAATLNSLIAKFGASSQAVKDWLAAQDMVFDNCGGYNMDDKPAPAKIPAELHGDADPLLKQNRAYQIAAAHFYSQDFDAAEKEFDAIAHDTASPWSHIAPYLAIRSLIRKATLSYQKPNMDVLQAAEKRLQKLMQDSAYKDLYDSLLKLNDYVAARLVQRAHLDDLAGRMAANITADGMNEYTKTVDLAIGDEGDNESPEEYGKLPAEVKDADMTDWIFTFQTSDDASNKHAIEKWKQTKSLPWLVAALIAVDSDDKVNAPAIANAASQVAKNSPAYWTILYHLNLLNIDQGKEKSVLSSLDSMLAAPPPNLPPSSRNSFATQRLVYAGNLDQFVRYGIQRPVCLCTSGGTEQVPDDVGALMTAKTYPINDPLFTEEAGYCLDEQMPLSVLRQLVKNPKVPANLRAHLAWTAWVRAVLIGDEVSAKDLAVTMRPFNKRKAPLIDTYLAATTPDARRFAAIMLMLQFSSANPNVGWGPISPDTYGDDAGWWWGDKPVPAYGTDPETSTRQKFDPRFVTPAQMQQAKSELKKLAAVENAPTYFAENVLAWAQKHPTDPRVPQALHLAVKATRYGMTDNTTSILSKKAFQVLHTKYKGSPWTKKTPYYY